MALTLYNVSVNIAAGAALSQALNVGEKVPCAIEIPSGWTGTPALTFQVSDDGVNWWELLDNNGNAITVAATAASTRYNLFSTDFQSARYFKVRSGTSGTPANQTNAVTLLLIIRKFYPVD
jgi:hypothetical protein